jgi:SAM-dependent methyltransferase
MTEYLNVAGLIEAIKEEIRQRGQFSFTYCKRFCSLLIDTIIVTIRIRRIPSAKILGELVWWYRFIRQYRSWYYKLDHRLRVEEFNLIGNIAMAHAKLVPYYTILLNIPKDYFQGMRILDVGCGPLPHSLEFTDCEIYGIDPLIDMYKRLNFPIEKYSDRYNVVNAPAECMPFKDEFFDAIISINAIDHVDDLLRVAGEITRVLRPGGIFILCVESHRPRLLEPWFIDDEIVKTQFNHLTIRRIIDIPSSGCKCYHLAK